MTSTEDIMTFLNQVQEAREREKETELRTRAEERKEDMQKILEIISSGVKQEVNSLVKPLEERLANQEKVKQDMSRQLKTIMKELEVLNDDVGKQEFPHLPDISGQVYTPNERLATPRLECEEEDRRNSSDL